MVAPSTASVLITGESGTGKELVAPYHSFVSAPARTSLSSPSTAPPFPRRSSKAKSSATRRAPSPVPFERRTGCFELAEGGTLLLDEIGEMPIGTQAKLLRVLEDRKLRPAWSKRPKLRLTCASSPPPTNLPEEAVARGDLRNDLYYRLNVFNIHMPPLREHRKTSHRPRASLLAEMNRSTAARVATVSEAVMNAVSAPMWPGNVARTAQHPGACGHYLRKARSDRDQAPAAGFRASGVPTPPPWMAIPFALASARR